MLKASIREALLTAVDPYILWDVFPAGKGGAGLLYLPKKDTITPAFLVELKRKRSPYSVIRQIKSHNYPACLQAYSGKLLLAGISYDPKSWEHKCTFETFDVS